MTIHGNSQEAVVLNQRLVAICMELQLSNGIPLPGSLFPGQSFEECKPAIEGLLVIAQQRGLITNVNIHPTIRKTYMYIEADLTERGKAIANAASESVSEAALVKKAVTFESLRDETKYPLRKLVLKTLVEYGWTKDTFFERHSRLAAFKQEPSNVVINERNNLRRMLHEDYELTLRMATNILAVVGIEIGDFEFTKLRIEETQPKMPEVVRTTPVNTTLFEFYDSMTEPALYILEMFTGTVATFEVGGSVKVSKSALALSVADDPSAIPMVDAILYMLANEGYVSKIDMSGQDACRLILQRKGYEVLKARHPDVSINT